jgi:hypothetical protein
MRTLLAAALLASLAFTATGCPLGCSAYQGSNDKVLARGSDQLILCDNGGYAADIGTTTYEGFYTDNPAGNAIAVVGTDGATSQHAFDLSYDATGVATIPQFGGDTWQPVALDQTGLDHADTRCQDLETRGWWSTTQP